VSMPAVWGTRKLLPAVNRTHEVGNYCSDRGDGAAEGEEM
jgi:hypothetical protein